MYSQKNRQYKLSGSVQRVPLTSSWILTFTSEYFIFQRCFTEEWLPFMYIYINFLNFQDEALEVTAAHVELTGLFKVVVSRRRPSGKLPSKRSETGPLWQP